MGASGRSIRKVTSPLCDIRREESWFSRLILRAAQHVRMRKELAYSIRSIRFDENYVPPDNTRATTNFANLARGDRRRDNLCNAFRMIDNRFNALAHWDNPNADRYSVELDIISAEISIGGRGRSCFPLIEILKPTILDRATGKRIEGIAGNNFSSYVRDYDFSIVLPQYNGAGPSSARPRCTGDLHGNLFEGFLNSAAYKAHFQKPPAICLSVSSNRIYQRIENEHPLLGAEYRQDSFSSTRAGISEKMGMQVRFFMPRTVLPPGLLFHRRLPSTIIPVLSLSER